MVINLLIILNNFTNFFAKMLYFENVASTNSNLFFFRIKEKGSSRNVQDTFCK